MNLTTYLTSLFFPGSKIAGLDVEYKLSQSKPGAVKNLFTFLVSLVDQALLPSNLDLQFKNLEKLITEGSEQKLIVLYKEFETFILSSELPVVKKQFDAQMLREEISKNIELTNLSEYFRLIFLPREERFKALVVASFKQVEPSVRQNLGVRMSESLTKAFENLEVQTAYSKIRDSVGVVHAVSIFRQIYEFIRLTYPYDLVALFIDVLPEKEFAEERGFILAQKMVDGKINEATKLEKNKLLEQQELYKQLRSQAKEIEEKNKSFEDTQRAMMNLLGDSKELELSLKNERDRVEAIVSSMGEGLFVLNEKHQIDFMNPVAEKLLGITVNDAKGKDWADIVITYKGENKIPLIERSTVSSLRAGKVVITNLEDDHYYLTKSGKKFPVTSMTTPLIKDGKVIGAIKVFRDATTDKLSKEHVEGEVVKRTAQLSASINSLALGFIMINSEEVISLINKVAQDILEIKTTLGSLKDLAKIITFNPSIETLILDSHKEKKLIEIKEISFGNKFLHFYIAPIIANIGKNESDIGTVILFDDITEEKVLNRSKDEFFSIASHELRTPLTAIKGNTSLILDHYKEKLADPELKEMIDDIHESSIRLIDIVNDFLNVSRLEQGRLEFKPTAFNLAELITKSLGEYQVTGSRNKIGLEFVAPVEAIPEVYADLDRVRQILINLIGNGIKYTDTGGVKISLKNVPGFVNVYISDSGRGIPPQNQVLLFHKFQQAGSSLYTRDTSKGTGLGLYISKLMVEGMGGKIWLESSIPGKGSVFAFCLPVFTKRTIANSKEYIDNK